MPRGNEHKIILDLCGGTGSWSWPYAAAGYDVRVITLPDYDVLRTDFVHDTLIQFHGASQRINSIEIRKVHGILAAPPCTMFSRARTTAKTPRDFEGAMSVVSSCMRIIWECRTHGNLEWWALENPMGILRQFLGNPGFSFRGWEYGDSKHMKFTDLWGYFNRPIKKRGAKKPTKFNRVTWASPKKPKKYADLPLDRAGIRSITPPGFAKAFFKANP